SRPMRPAWISGTASKAIIRRLFWACISSCCARTRTEVLGRPLGFLTGVSLGVCARLSMDEAIKSSGANVSRPATSPASRMLTRAFGSSLHARRSRILRPGAENLATPRQPVRPEVVTHVLGTFRYLCVRAGQSMAGGDGGIRTLDRALQ